MNVINKISDFFDEKRRSKHKRIRERNDKMRALGKNPTKKGWGSMVNTGSGGINKNPIDRVYDIAQQQKNIAEEKELQERRSGEVKRK